MQQKAFGEEREKRDGEKVGRARGIKTRRKGD